MSEQHHDTPRLLVPAPVVYGVGIIGGLLINAFVPLPFVPDGWRLPLFLLLVIPGLMLGFGALWAMYRRKTSPFPEKPTTAIVSAGVFAISRNPIYLSFTLATLAFAVIFDTLWLIIALVPILIVIHYGVILREERYLERKFGDEYLQYKAKVRRWL